MFRKVRDMETSLRLSRTISLYLKLQVIQLRKKILLSLSNDANLAADGPLQSMKGKVVRTMLIDRFKSDRYFKKMCSCDKLLE